MIHHRIFLKLYQWAAQKMCRQCQPFIKKGSKILDLGCGSGVVAKNFQQFFQSPVMGVDIEDRRIVDLPFQKIDGRTLPFGENDFDVVLIAYVLHHAQDPEALLREAKRVSRGKILIYEDLLGGPMLDFVCKFHGFTFDKFVQKKNETRFKTEQQWRELFTELGLKLVFDLRVDVPFIPMKKKLFVLEKMGI